MVSQGMKFNGTKVNLFNCATNIINETLFPKEPQGFQAVY